MREPNVQEILAAIDGGEFDVYTCWAVRLRSLPLPGWPDRNLRFDDLRRVLRELIDENAALKTQNEQPLNENVATEKEYRTVSVEKSMVTTATGGNSGAGTNARLATPASGPVWRCRRLVRCLRRRRPHRRGLHKARPHGRNP